MTTRWPLHPTPIEGEALSSWLYRIAEQYGVQIQHLLLDMGYVLDPHVDLNVTTPDGLPQQLAQRTGLDEDRIRMMSLSGYIPWLMDNSDSGPEYFSTYTRQLSVLLPEGSRRDRSPEGWQAWTSTPDKQHNWLCPTCVGETTPPRAYLLAWSYPLMRTCPLHRCLLEPYEGTLGYFFLFHAPPATSQPHALDHPLTVMDKRTWQALTSGYVDLPRRRVHAGLWFRLLRTIIDELGATVSECGKDQNLSRAVWEHLGYRHRAGQSGWRPFERFPVLVQQQTLEAAATAMHLLENKTLAGKGKQADLFLPVPEPVAEVDLYAPEDEATNSWRKVKESIDAAVKEAQQDREAARRLFRFLTHYQRDDEKYVQEVRDNFEELGISLEHLSHK